MVLMQKLGILQDIFIDMVKVILAIAGHFVKVIEDCRLGQLKNTAQKTNLLNPFLRLGAHLKRGRDTVLFVLGKKGLVILNRFDKLNRAEQQSLKIFWSHGLKNGHAVHQIQHLSILGNFLSVRNVQKGFQTVKRLFFRSARDVAQNFEKATDGKACDARRQAVLGDRLHHRTAKDAHFCITHVL